MTDQPRVSILIISYNQEAYIRASIDSALSQDYPNIEIIVSDDGSSDATQDIIMEYASRYPDKVLPVLSGVNRGITSNCNSGLAKVSGKYFTHFGADDIIYPSKVRTQVDWLEGSTARVLCAHQVDVFYENGRTSHPLSGLLAQGKGSDQVLRHGGLGALSVMVRTDSMPDHGFESRLPMISDYMLWAEVLANGGEFMVLPDFLGGYRQHETNVTKNPVKYIKDVITYYDIFEERYPQYSASCRYGRARHAFYDPGVSLYRIGMFRESSDYFRKAIATDPIFLKAWIRLMQCRLRSLAR
ncbi:MULTISPECIES: glycosyltransferase [unclassified Sphingomonas]|uniref:glycosyltransferase n=1 Tax=unclassified Sphingomonas TaxID=196159 RepID=UPI00226B2170|nr:MULTISPECIES: glycosyltransferase [unclassified Sphingomonas]